MNPEEIARIGEVNREEIVEGIYRPGPDDSGLGIIARYEVLEKPEKLSHWSEAGTEGRIKSWKPALDNGGAMYGAFEGDTFAGFIILSPPRNDASAEVVALFIDKHFRRKGVGVSSCSGQRQDAKK